MASVGFAQQQSEKPRGRDALRAKYLSFADAQIVVVQYADSGFPGSTISDATTWDNWIREQDLDVRKRIDAGVEDSISNLSLFGTSFTKLPRVESAEDAEATGTGELTTNASARLDDLAKALAGSSTDERLVFVRKFLKQKGVSAAQCNAFLQSNLLRYAREQRAYRQKLDAAAKTGEPNERFATRGTLFATRGLSADTSLLPNYAIEDTLQVMLAKGALAPGEFRRIAILGPGLDFADKRDGYDFYPLQTIQPFAVMEAVERLHLAKREDLKIFTFDLNAAVNAHITRLAANGKRRRPYTVQLPRDPRTNWTSQAIQYWKHFGEVIGTPAKPLPVPAQLADVEVKAVSISADRAARIVPMDVNIVAQSVECAPGEGFDLVIATNILVYYDRFQQALAMSNIARMMNPGGIFLSNTPLPSAHDERLKYLGGRSVTYSEDRSYGDDIVVYRLQQ